ncbi:DUF6538 domain-containing protein [Vibrio algarum]|uniref:DUF6538 domain-containing protein n=1 Tax=Vibrio algarum TaxID=3020714 RepID=UPI002AC370D1|nr:DUF6538 domain-containing protein [Vibrio sp. KJ40-1]
MWLGLPPFKNAAFISGVLLSNPTFFPGIWYFRYQIPARFRSFFPNGREIKKSLSTRSLNTTRLEAPKFLEVHWKRLSAVEVQDNHNLFYIPQSSSIRLRYVHAMIY